MSPVALKALSFVGGAVIVGAAAATLIAVSPKIRSELERQASQLLDITREAIVRGQDAVQRIQAIGGTLVAHKERPNTDALPSHLPEYRAYEAQWSKVQ